MSTPTVITFQGGGNYGPAAARHLYRHLDGDPVTQLDVIATVIRKAANLAHSYSSKVPHIAERCIVTPSTLIGLYIGETTGTFGMSAEFILHPATFGSEWVYTIDTDKKTIEITDEDGTPVDPYTYLDKLHDKCVQTHRESLDGSIAFLNDMGYKVLPNCIEVI